MAVKARILIADDNAGLRETLSLILRERGCDVATAADGPEALDRAREADFDVIFMDVRMPDMDGVETCRRVKGVSPAARVVLMTAFSSEDRVQDAMREGACAVLRKPLDMDQVLAMIDEVVAAGKGRREPR